MTETAIPRADTLRPALLLPLPLASAVLVFLLQWWSVGLDKALMAIPGSLILATLAAGLAGRLRMGWFLAPAIVLVQGYLSLLYPPLGWLTTLLFAVLLATGFRAMTAPLLEDRYWPYALGATAIILINTITHLAALSPIAYILYGDPPKPYAHSFDNGLYMVMADNYHWQATIAVFRPNWGFDPQYSLVLRRFLHPYALGLLPWLGKVWLLGIALAVWLWVGSLGALASVGERLGLSSRAIGWSLVGYASAYGVVAFVAQPMPYAMSYLMVPWMTLAFMRLGGPDTPAGRLLCLGGLAAGISLYDMFPLMAAGICYLLLKRRWTWAAATAALQVALPMAFTLLLRHVLGTEGDLKNAQIMSGGLETWLGALKAFEVARLLTWLRVAVMNLGWSLLFAPALLLFVHLGVRLWRTRKDPSQRWEPTLPLLFTLATVGAYFVLAPAMYKFSGAGLLPRISYYPFPFAILATCWASERISPRIVWFYPAILLVLAQWDFFTGSQWLARAFTFGH